MKVHRSSPQHGAYRSTRPLRNWWFVGSILALVAASCGSGSSADNPTTTVLATTTTATTLPPTTTTIGDAEPESDLLAARLVEMPNYRYYDYDPALLESDLRNLNATPSAREVFSSTTRHIVAYRQHYIAELQSFEVRDATLGIDDVIGPLQDTLRLTGTITRSSINIGDYEVVRIDADDMHLWAWVDNGVLHVVYFMGYEGNEAFGYDFVAAAASEQQGLDLPEPTASAMPTDSQLKVEDEHLVSHLLPVGGYLYLDPSFDTSVGFYGWMETLDALLRASNHIVVSEADLAEENWNPLMNVQVWAVTSDIVGDPAELDAFTDMLATAYAGDDSYAAVLELQAGGQTVKYAMYVSGDGTPGETFVFEHAGLLYIVHAAPSCTATVDPECNQQVVEFVLQFAAAVEQTT